MLSKAICARCCSYGCSVARECEAMGQGSCAANTVEDVVQKGELSICLPLC